MFAFLISNHAAGMASAPQSVAHHADGDAGGVHGGAGHVHRQHRAAAHRRQSVGDAGGGDVGADELSGCERHRAADDRLAGKLFRPQTRFAFVHRDVHAGVGAVRAGVELADADHGADFSGRSAAARWCRSRSPSCWKVFRRKNAARRWRCLRRAWSWHRFSARCSAAGSRTVIPGAGFFTSTCRWEFSRC